jgi:hypothetical protein
MDKNDIEPSALLEEYKCLKSEIAANLAASRQATNLTLLALGLIAGGAKVLTESDSSKVLTEADSYWPLLLGPPVFLALMLSQLRYTYLAVEMSVYIDKSIARRLRTLAKNQDVMGWESNQFELVPGSRRWREDHGYALQRLRWLPIRGATLLLPLLGAMICLVLYCGIRVQNDGISSLWSLDLLSILSLIEVALVVGAALYSFVSAQALERARYIGTLRNNIDVPAMLPHFHVTDEQPTRDAVVGSISTVSPGSKTWVGEGWIGYLMSPSMLIPGRWHRHHELWAFTPERPGDIASIRGQHEWSVLDGYWGERAELVLDRDRKWRRTRFEPTDAVRTSEPGGAVLMRSSGAGTDEGELVKSGWDHEHCALCWEKIGPAGQTEGYRSPPHTWLCERCYVEYVAKRSLEFIQNV